MRKKRFGVSLVTVLMTLGVAVTANVAPASGGSLATSSGSAGPGCQADRRTDVYLPTRVLPNIGQYEPCLLDTGMATGESGLAIENNGTLLRSVATNPAGIAVSTNNGATWQRHLLPNGASTSIGDGYFDPVTNRYFYSAFLAGVYYTDNSGASWSTGTFDSSLRFDWPKMFSGPPVSPRSGYPTNIYYCDFTLPLGVVDTDQCFVSTNGGETFVETGAALVPQLCSVPPTVSPGRGVVDPRNGTIYLTTNICGHLVVNVSTDDGATWTQHVVSEASTGSALDAVRILDSPAYLKQLASGMINPVGPQLSAAEVSDDIAVDSNGRLYIVWVDGSSLQPYFATSDDDGRTWSKPVLVSPPGVLQAVLPSITVARNGRVGLSYYGTSDNTAWTGYLTVILYPLTNTPVLQSSSVTLPGQPLMSSPCCWLDGSEEYTEARWASDGSLWSAFAEYTASGTAEGVLGRLAYVN